MSCSVNHLPGILFTSPAGIEKSAKKLISPGAMFDVVLPGDILGGEMFRDALGPRLI